MLPIRGMDSEVSGIFSAIANMKTENAKSTVTPRAIFSPESGGKQNTSTVNVLIIMQGNTMLYLKKIKNRHRSVPRYSILSISNSIPVLLIFMTYM